MRPICYHDCENTRILIITESWNNRSNISYAALHEVDFTRNNTYRTLYLYPTLIF